MLAKGIKAPEFTLPNQDGDLVSLGDFIGRPVVLYFYPRASTPGCTVQACGVRDHSEDYAALGAVVIGISPDPVKGIKKFHEKQELNFNLLADADHRVAEQYGVWVEKAFMGKKYWGVSRSTYIIDPEGNISDVIKKASPKTHDEKVLKLLADEKVH